MSDKVDLTITPRQITSGSESAHITVTDGYVMYADSENSAAWHRADRILNVTPPVALWMKVASGQSGSVTVTKFTE